jgi:4-aminobutyrate aminotransferase-like enzyme
MANLDYIRKHDLIGNSERMGKILQDGLAELKEKHRLIGESRGKGLMVGVELVKNRKTKEPAAPEVVRVMELMKDDGVLVGRGGYYNNVLRLTPPLIVNKDDVSRALGALDRALTAVEKTMAS